MLKALLEIETMLDRHPHFLPDEVQAVRACAEKVKENAALREKLEEERKRKEQQHEKLSSMATQRHSVLEQITQTLSLYGDTPPEVQEMYQYLLRQHLLIVKARDDLANELSAFVNDSPIPINPLTQASHIEEEPGHNDIMTESEPEPEPAPAPAPALHQAEDPDFAQLDLDSIINLGNLGDIVESNIRHRNLNEENLYPDGELNGRLDIIVEESEDQDDRPPSIVRQYSERE